MLVLPPKSFVEVRKTPPFTLPLAEIVSELPAPVIALVLGRVRVPPPPPTR